MQCIRPACEKKRDKLLSLCGILSWHTVRRIGIYFAFNKFLANANSIS